MIPRSPVHLWALHTPWEHSVSLEGFPGPSRAQRLTSAENTHAHRSGVQERDENITWSTILYDLSVNHHFLNCIIKCTIEPRFLISDHSELLLFSGTLFSYSPLNTFYPPLKAEPNACISVTDRDKELPPPSARTGSLQTLGCFPPRDPRLEQLLLSELGRFLPL